MTHFTRISLEVIKTGLLRQWVDYAESPLSTSEVELHGRKVMLCVWLDHRGIHFVF